MELSAIVTVCVVVALAVVAVVGILIDRSVEP